MPSPETSVARFKRTAIQPDQVDPLESRFVNLQIHEIEDDRNFHLEAIIRHSKTIIPNLTEVGLLEHPDHPDTGLVVGHVRTQEEEGVKRVRVVLGAIDSQGNPWTAFAGLPLTAYGYGVESYEAGWGKMPEFFDE